MSCVGGVGACVRVRACERACAFYVRTSVFACACMYVCCMHAIVHESVRLCEWVYRCGWMSWCVRGCMRVRVRVRVCMCGLQEFTKQ